jgi:hypothetical protein
MRRESAAPPTHILTTSRQQARTLLRTQTLDGILEHQFNKRLESFVPCYSQSLLLRILKKTILFSGFKPLTKKSAKQENWSLLMNSVL